jgi:hypothetical protein
MENINSIYSIIIAVITILGSAGAWKYYENRAKEKRDDDNFIKWDCRDRIAKLEVLLERSSAEKDDMRKIILDLTSQVSELRVKIEFLEAENQKLKRLQ